MSEDDKLEVNSKSNNPSPTPTHKAYFFFVDIVGLSSNSFTAEQVVKIDELNKFLTKYLQHNPNKINFILPTGDGMAIEFKLDEVEAPLNYAIELQEYLDKYNAGHEKDPIDVRIGIAFGFVQDYNDYAKKPNIWGPGIIMARRVMDLGQSRHILLDKSTADDLYGLAPEKYKNIIKNFEEEYEIKHGNTIQLYYFYDGTHGSPIPPPHPVQIKMINESLIKIKNSISNIEPSVVNLDTHVRQMIYRGMVTQTELRKEYEKLRIGATQIKATWFGHYEKMDEYFIEEFNFIDKFYTENVNSNKHLSIQRIINFMNITLEEQRIHEDYVKTLREIYEDETDKMYQCVTTSSDKDIEHMVTKNENKIKALFSILPTSEPVFGVRLDPEQKPEFTNQVEALEEWFDDMWEENKNNKFMTNAELWDGLAEKFNVGVQGSKEYCFITYRKNELKKIVPELKKYTDRCKTIVEIGCGAGRVLKKLAGQKDFKNIKFIGVDASHRMIKEANTNVKNLKNKPHFYQYDATIWDEQLQNINDAQPKIVLCLLNTICNIYPDKLDDFVLNLARLATKDGVIIISVFIGGRFKDIARPIYESLNSLVGPINESNFNNEKMLFRTSQGYFSQWITESELKKHFRPYFKNNKDFDSLIEIPDKGNPLAKIYIIKPTNYS